MKKLTQAELYTLARERFQTSNEWDSSDREAALDDKEFYSGRQWDGEMESVRVKDGRPVMTINILPKFVRQVTGEARMNEAAIDVSPVDDGADPALADVYSGLVRTIESENNAETIYEEAIASSAMCGRGYFRIYTEYEHDMSFDQVIKMDIIPEALSVYFDPGAKKYNKSDAEYCFITQWMPEEKFTRLYGEDASSYLDAGIGDDSLWVQEGQKRVCEYWHKEHREKEIWLVATDTGYTVIAEDDMWTKDGLEAEGYKIVETRKVDVVTVFMYEMGGSGWLSRDKKKEDDSAKYGQEFVSQYIPIIPVMGPEVRVRGEIFNWSVIRWAKTPQVLYNLWTSTAAEKTSLSPKAPWLGTPTMFEGFEASWADANVSNPAYLLYNPDPDAPTAMPQRNFPEPIHAAELALRQSAYEDMMHSTGLASAALGEQGNEVSGVAINARQGESDIGTIDWVKNLHRSIEHAGTVMVDMIPKVYSTERAINILGEDGTAEFVKLNQLNPVTGELDNDITKGRYNVRINSGPSFKTAREQTATNLIQLMAAVPMYGHLFLDYVLSNMDFKDAEKAAKRVEMALGLPDPDNPPPPPGPPELTPEQQMKMQKDAAELEGKQLVNAQREYDLTQQLTREELTEAVRKDVMETIEQAARTPYMGPGQMGGQ